MVDIRPSQLPDAILPLGSNNKLVIDQDVVGVNKATVFDIVDSVAPVATQAEAVAGADNVKRMTSLRTKQSIASEVGVTLASSSQGAKADSAVQSVNGKTGNSVTLVKGDVGLGNVDNTYDLDKPISTATQTALNAKANSSVTVSAGTGLTGGGNLTANRTVSLNAASIASLAKADSAVQPSRSITAGTGLSGGGDLSANRILSLSAATQTSLAKADTAIQAPGGATGQILAKNSNAENDVGWISSEAATSVSYAPQTLTEAQQGQARSNIDAQQAGEILEALRLASGAAANRLPYMTSASNAAFTPISNFGKSLIDDGDAATARATLGGTAIGQDLFTSPTAGAAWAALGTAEVAANTGYTKLPSGLIIQWGIITSIGSDGGASFTFPIAFPNNRFVLLASIAGPWVVPPYALIVYPSWEYSKTGGKVWCRDHNGSPATGNVHWIAIGK